MNLPKFNPWVVGSSLIFAASLIFYLESYRNNEWIDITAYVAGLFGWVTLFARATKGTAIDAKKILFKDDKAGWFIQGLGKFFYYMILMVVMFGDGYLTFSLAQDRKRDILDNRPTKTTIATIDHIEASSGRSGTTYQAIFKYRANGETVTYPWYEHNESDFLIGDKYLIKYSVEYPQMFAIIDKEP